MLFVIVCLFVFFRSACNFEDRGPISSHISESICTEVCPFTWLTFKNNLVCAQSPSVLSQLNDVKEHENGFPCITDHPAGNTESEYLSILHIVAHHSFIYLQRQRANLTTLADHFVN